MKDAIAAKGLFPVINKVPSKRHRKSYELLIHIIYLVKTFSSLKVCNCVLHINDIWYICLIFQEIIYLGILFTYCNFLLGIYMHIAIMYILTHTSNSSLCSSYIQLVLLFCMLAKAHFYKTVRPYQCGHL